MRCLSGLNDSAAVDSVVLILVEIGANMLLSMAVSF